MSEKEYETKDSGHRQEFETGAVRDRQEGKGRYDLMSVFAMQRLAGVHERGAAKYTRWLPVSSWPVVQNMANSCSCQNNHIVTQTLDTMRAVCVDPATRKIFEGEIALMLRDRERTLNSGQWTTEKESKLLIALTRKILGTEKDESSEKELKDFLGLVSRLSKETESLAHKEESASSAEKTQDRDGLTATMTTLQENFEDSYAQNATRVSAFLEILKTVFAAHSHTCKIHQELKLTDDIAIEDKVFLQFYDGNRNWEKGMPLSRFLDSAIRHLLQLMEGKDDEDHAAQALWNIAAYIHIKEMIDRGLLPAELDDMPCYMPEDADPNKWKK